MDVSQTFRMAKVTTYRTHSSCDLGKLSKARCRSAGKLLLSDHVRNLNTVQSSRSGSERFKLAHVPHATLDKPMILLNQVIQILGPDRLDFGWATKTIKDFVHLSNARLVGATFVDDDLARVSI